MQDNPQALLPKAQLSVVSLPGSRPLSNTRHEHYSRLRSLLCPKGRALREAGMRAVKNRDAVSNATRLERRQDVRDRIAYLVRQEEEVLAEKRKRIEERLWAIHEADIGDFFERYDKEVTDKNGNIETDEKGAVLRQACERPKLLADLSPETAKLIEDVSVDSRGRLIPKLYSKLKHAQYQRQGSTARCQPIIRCRADLHARAASRELGISIDLNYTFHQPKKADE